MSYKARVFRVFIASPSDVLLEREITRNVLEQWNSINSEREKIVLVPIGWETNAAPEMGRPAQDYINMDILDTCDVVIGKSGKVKSCRLVFLVQNDLFRFLARFF